VNITKFSVEKSETVLQVHGTVGTSAKMKIEGKEWMEVEGGKRADDR